MRICVCASGGGWEIRFCHFYCAYFYGFTGPRDVFKRLDGAKRLITKFLVNIYFSFNDTTTIKARSAEIRNF